MNHSLFLSVTYIVTIISNNSIKQTLQVKDLTQDHLATEFMLLITIPTILPLK